MSALNRHTLGFDKSSAIPRAGVSNSNRATTVGVETMKIVNNVPPLAEMHENERAISTRPTLRANPDSGR